MSITKNRSKLFSEVVEQIVRRASISRLGNPLQSDNLVLVQDALCIFAMTWYDLLVSGGVSTTKLSRRWLLDVTSIDLIDFVDCLKMCDSLLLAREEGITDYSCFKHRIKTDFPFVGMLISPLKDIFDQLGSSDPIPSFALLHQAFTVISRLNLPKLSDLKQKAFDEYVAQNEKLQTLEECNLTSEEEQIIAAWFPRSSRFEIFKHWKPSHGPGAVADKNCKSVIDKYNSFGSDCLIRYIDKKLPKFAVPLPRPIDDHMSVKDLRCSRVVFVPKSTSKLRTICAEPTTLQWYQQGFFRSIDRYINRHRYLKKRINLSVQELNRDLALKGSIDGSYATIDLSAASDSVSFQHIRRWFYSSGLREALVCTRSKFVELPDKSVEYNYKFAPMGSALCFPVECLVFCAIVEASIREDGGDVHASNYRVYGDDIIVETQFAPTVIKRLEKNGFVVNTTKSFFHARPTLNFRESCGGEYLDGVDVAPIRLSREFKGLSNLGMSSSKILCAVDLCNSCYTKLPSVRQYIIGKLLELPKNCLVHFGLEGKGALYSPQPTNFHIARRYPNNNFQEMEMWVGAACVYKQRSRLRDEDIRYYEYQRTLADLDRSHTKMISHPDNRYLRFTRLRTHTYEEPILISITSPRKVVWKGKLYHDTLLGWSRTEPT